MNNIRYANTRTIHKKFRVCSVFFFRVSSVARYPSTKRAYGLALRAQRDAPIRCPRSPWVWCGVAKNIVVALLVFQRFIGITRY